MASPVNCLAPKGIRPNIPLQRVREYTYVYSAISPHDGDVFSLILPCSDTAAMQLFMDEFSEHLNGQPTLLIMDQAPWHKNNQLIVPEHLREKYTANKFWHNMTELEDALCEALRDCKRNSGTIKSLTFFDWMVYK